MHFIPPQKYSFEQLSSSQKAEAARLTVIDLAFRSLPGTFMYVLGWFFLYFVIQSRSDDAHTDQWLKWISTIVVLGAVLRILLVLLAKQRVDQTAKARALLVVGMLINSLTWGVMAASAFIATPLAAHSEIILLTTAGISAGGAISFSVSRLFTGLFLCGMLLPTVLLQTFIVETTDFGVLAAVTIYLAGMYMVTINPYREYKSALTSTLMLTHTSNTDGLTSLLNRRAFDEQLEEEVQRAQRSGYRLTLLLLDIDHFKRINDEYGHPAGDHCLVCVGQVLMDSIGRSSDTIARYGGEEFAIILPNVNADSASQMAEKIRLAVEAGRVSFEGVEIALTISIGGCTSYNLDKHESSGTLVSLADKALYNAKNAGRNCVVFNEQNNLSKGQTQSL